MASADFLKLIEHQRSALQAQAFPQGQVIYAEPTAAFIERISVYWQTTRA